MRLFFDTEFTDLKQDCELISIGVVADDGNPDTPNPVFYAESIDFGEDKCSDFVKENVLPYLKMGKAEAFLSDDGNGTSCAVCGTEEDIAMHLDDWMKNLIKPGEKIEIWSDCLSYDWVLFCSLFEHIGGLPPYVYYIPFDICTYMKIKGVDPDISREDFVMPYYKDDMKQLTTTNWGKHNSLFDAMVIYYCYNTLKNHI